MDEGAAIDRFTAHVRDAAAQFTTLPRDSPVRLISHLDADGISACAIMIKALSRESRLHAVKVIQSLDERILQELAREDYGTFIFVDLGSGQLKDIARILAGKRVFILDHHAPQELESLPLDITHVNPHLFGIDGTSAISGSGVTWLFSQELNPANKDMAHIAIIGMLGDMQDRSSPLNNMIVESAIASEKVSARKGLRFFGMQTRPLHKVLEYSTDPFIPNVSGSESGAIQFLKQLSIEPKDDRQQWRRMIDLSEEEMKQLATGIILRRTTGDAPQDSPEDIMGDVYIMPGEKEGTPLRDAKEFSTVLNACGRMNRASVGIGACLGNPALKKAALDTVAEYRRSIMNALRWVENNRGSDFIQEKKGYVVINARSEIPHAIIGTVASILSKKKLYASGTIILSLAETNDQNLKASLRVCGRSCEVDLRELIVSITRNIQGAKAGGHRAAAGALIPGDAEEEFVESAHTFLRKHALEERVV